MVKGLTKKLLLLMVVCLGIFSAGVTVTQAQETIQILCPDYQPFSNESGKGLWGDLIRAAYQKEGVQVQWAFRPMARERADVQSGQNVAFLAGALVVTPDIRSSFLMSPQPFTFIDIVAFYSAKKFPGGLGIKSPKDLQGRNVGVVLGTGSVSVLQDAGVKLDIAPDVDFLMKKLNSGRNDVAVVADLTGLDSMKTNFPAAMNQYKYESVYNSPIDLIFSAKHPQAADLQKKFLSGLAKIKADGTFMAIVKRWYPSGRINQNVLPVDMRK